MYIRYTVKSETIFYQKTHFFSKYNFDSILRWISIIRWSFSSPNLPVRSSTQSLNFRSQHEGVYNVDISHLYSDDDKDLSFLFLLLFLPSLSVECILRRPPTTDLSEKRQKEGTNPVKGRSAPYTLLVRLTPLVTFGKEGPVATRRLGDSSLTRTLRRSSPLPLIKLRSLVEGPLGAGSEIGRVTGRLGVVVVVESHSTVTRRRTPVCGGSLRGPSPGLSRPAVTPLPPLSLLYN